MRLSVGSLAFLCCVLGLGGCRPAPASPPPTAITVVKPTADAPFDRTFAWQPIEGATQYQVIVFNGAGERSFEVHDVRGTSVALAASVGLAPGRYSWKVIGLRDGKPLLESPVTPFDLK